MTKVTLFSATLGEDGKIEPPLGPLYIAAALEQIGLEVDFRDYQLHEGSDCYSADTFVRALEGHEEYVLISCFVDMLPVVLAACKKLKAADPGCKIILGGPGVSGNARELMEAFAWVDGIVRGEGEKTIQAFFGIDVLATLVSDPVAGLVWRAGDTLVDGSERPRITDADNLPWPAYHLLDWSRYSSARVITTRGCPYKCSFCDVAPLWGRRAVYRDVKRAVDEIVMLRDRFGIDKIAIVDDTFVLNRDRVRAFCREILDRGIKIEWGCFGRINLMNEDLVSLMSQAGCRAVFYGIDSGAQKVLNRTFKELRAETVLPTLEMSQRYFDRVEASFIWGYPFETLEDFEETLALASAASQLAPKVNVQMHMLSPLPSSPIYLNFEGTLQRPAPEDSDWLLLPAVLLDERAAEVAEVIDMAPHLFPGFFNLPTENRDEKRAYLEKSMRALDFTVGSSLFDKEVLALMEAGNRLTEERLLQGAEDDADRIGIGLALGLFRRTRRRNRKAASTVDSAARGPSMVRQRNDLQQVTS
ncbi:radical SAM protein [Acuticoccus sp. MNP-M23]|uniref:B12-binding domain-containing radical SAM protein n=1 Tax=Acuticoccus sp. MNP-M23 TaxID=3072793 RepID=UPI002815EFE9|nr:radical SAM protein [Acuticoccus sp. MNP-M23]WMS44507.1 radical SAM protein [Acuticoccus sp. MNP-M23]